MASTATAKPHKTERADAPPRHRPSPASATQQPAERLKAVVRRLPPNLPEDVFWTSIRTWVTPETASWTVFHPGKLRKRTNKESIPSRAYIAFRSEGQLSLFSREYDGHVFRDKAGNESQAVVEYAPYQKVPTERKKVDPRNATIEKDEDYISFLASLKDSENAEPPSLEALLAASQPPQPPKTTPLLEALKAEKSAQKDKESILRNHVHYSAPPAVLRKEKGQAGASSEGGSKAATAPSASTSQKATGLLKGRSSNQKVASAGPRAATAGSKEASGTKGQEAGPMGKRRKGRARRGEAKAPPTNILQRTSTDESAPAGEAPALAVAENSGEQPSGEGSRNTTSPPTGPRSGGRRGHGRGKGVFGAPGRAKAV